MSDHRPALAAPDQRGGAPAQQEKRPLESFLTSPKVVEGIRDVAGAYLKPERMLRIVTFALRKVPKLAQCDPQSFLGAVMTSAALGLEPNTPQGHAYLIPYDKRGKLPGTGKWGVIGTECQFIIGYRGFIELAYRNPNIVKFIAKPIYQNDLFEHEEGSNSFLRYRATLTNRGPLIGAFAYAKYRTPGGAEAEMAVVLPLEEIHKARSKSETYNYLVGQVESADTDWKRASAEKKLAETPWVMWEGDMAAKTAIRKLAKVVPLGDAFAAAASMDDRTDGGGLDIASMSDPQFAKAVIDGEVDVPTIEHQETEEFEAQFQGPGEEERQPETVEQPRQRRQRQAKPKDEPQEQRREPDPEPEHEPETTGHRETTRDLGDGTESTTTKLGATTLDFPDD
jgi:recombination protein RecT